MNVMNLLLVLGLSKYSTVKFPISARQPAGTVVRSSLGVSQVRAFSPIDFLVSYQRCWRTVSGQFCACIVFSLT